MPLFWCRGHHLGSQGRDCPLLFPEQPVSGSERGLGGSGSSVGEVVLFKNTHLGKGAPGGAVTENPPANAGDAGSSPGPGRSHMPQSN